VPLGGRVWNPIEATERGAQQSDVQLRSRGIADIAEADDVTVKLKKDRATTLIIQPSPFTYLTTKSTHRFRVQSRTRDDIRVAIGFQAHGLGYEVLRAG
jgi:hypothetical protein